MDILIAAGLIKSIYVGLNREFFTGSISPGICDQVGLGTITKGDFWTVVIPGRRDIKGFCTGEKDAVIPFNI